MELTAPVPTACWGIAAATTLLRRAIKRAASHSSWSEPVIVINDGLDSNVSPRQPGNEDALGEVFGALRFEAAELRLPAPGGQDGRDEARRRLRIAAGEIFEVDTPRARSVGGASRCRMRILQRPLLG
jgi:hypothetical protein